VLSSLFLALLTPIVSAQYEGVYSMFGFLFGTGDGAFMFLKAGVWIILFAIIFWVARGIFSGSKGIATIFSIVVSLISIRFIPDEYIYYIGSAYGVFGIVMLILAIIGGTLLILNSYFPIKEHKAFGVVWALFYFFVAWIFEQLKNINTSSIPIDGIDELIELIGPWGKYISIVLGLACLYKAFSGRSKYAREPSLRPERQPDRRGEEEALRRELEEARKEREEERKQNKKELDTLNEEKKDEKEKAVTDARRKALHEKRKKLRNYVRKKRISEYNEMKDESEKLKRWISKVETNQYGNLTTRQSRRYYRLKFKLTNLTKKMNEYKKKIELSKRSID